MEPAGRGVGRAAVELAERLQLLRCTTTNHNLPARILAGAEIPARRAPPARAAADERRLKPSILLHGHDGLPIRDELDPELHL